MPSSRVFVLGNPDYCVGSGTPVNALPISVANWVKPANNNPAGVEIYFYYGDNGSDANYLTGQLTSDGYIKARARDSLTDFTGNVDFCDGGWHHIMFTYYNPTPNKAVELYVDGALATGTLTDNSAAEDIADFDTIAIGMARDNSPAAPCSCKIALAGIWNMRLVLANAQALYGGAPPSEVEAANLQAYYYNGTESDEDHKNAFDLTPNGSPSWDSGDWPIVGGNPPTGNIHGPLGGPLRGVIG